jgi:hypothetical protein
VLHGFAEVPAGIIRRTMNATDNGRPWADTDSKVTLRWVVTADGLQMHWTTSRADTAKGTMETVHEQSTTRAA